MAEPFLTPERLAAIKSGSREDERAESVRKSGLDLRPPSPDARTYRPRILHGGARARRTFWPRGDAAAARIHRILEGCARALSLSGAVENAEYRRLAKRYGELWCYYMTRGKPPPARGADHNPFRHLSDLDAERLFMRRVEDICDASTGVLGGWWVR